MLKISFTQQTRLVGQTCAVPSNNNGMRFEKIKKLDCPDSCVVQELFKDDFEIDNKTGILINLLDSRVTIKDYCFTY